MTSFREIVKLSYHWFHWITLTITYMQFSNSKLLIPTQKCIGHTGWSFVTRQEFHITTSRYYQSSSISGWEVISQENLRKSCGCNNKVGTPGQGNVWNRAGEGLGFEHGELDDMSKQKLYLQLQQFKIFPVQKVIGCQILTRPPTLLQGKFWARYALVE
jgi:hypothetical protein